MAFRFPESLALDVELDAEASPERLREAVARKLKVDTCELPPLRVLRRGVDARGGRVRLHLLVAEARETEPRTKARLPREAEGTRQVIVVGTGPAGLFCAYELACRGIRCTLLERGKEVQPRRRDLALLNREGRVDGESNYCFGEGGAGTYSDGKLYTRAKKRGDVQQVLDILALHGAPERILVDARPHIGSNKLPKVIQAMRHRLLDAGVTIRFESRVVELLRATRGAHRVSGVKLASGEELAADAVVLATGHSARDVFNMLDAAGVNLEAKAFALGVRIEHPQPLIDRIQYGASAGHPALGAASYRLATEQAGDKVFSFCMCPGGWIVPASTEAGALVVNGMSLSKRDSPYANSGLVVAISEAMLAEHGYAGPMGGIALQKRIEEAAFCAGGGELRAPATRATDFVAARASSSTPKSSYLPGLAATNVAEVLDAGGLPIAAALRNALQHFGRRMRGYLSEEAVLLGVESRTSSPVRIPRDPQSLESPDMPGLYPAGEGAGYAGGILSAALDGTRIAARIAEAWQPQP